VTEEQSEKRRQNEQQKQHAPVAINVEKLLVSDAGNGVEGSRVHEIVDKGKRPTSNVQRPTSTEENNEVILSFSLPFGRSRRKFGSALHFPRG
jgi:hypothetical protein